MEPKANYTLVGLFTLIFIGGIIVFLLWMTGGGFYETHRNYRIYFPSVSGLKEGSSVTYQGVLIGSVKSIDLNPEKIHEIRVTILVNRNIPIKKDVYATIQNQGITGTSIVQLNGGSNKAPELEKEYNEDMPVIKSRTSQLDQVFDSAPELINQVGQIAKNFNSVVSPDNRETFQDILDNVQEFTESLKDSDTGSLTSEIRNTIKQVKSSFGEMESTIKQVRSSFKEIENTMKDIRGILSENRQSIKNFSGTGLSAMTKFFDEGSETLSTYKRIGESIERSPARFFHNDPDKGVKVP